MKLAVFWGLVFLFLCDVTHACQICVPFPKKSVADVLIESDVVVLAREDTERPFHFRSVEILKGRLDEEAIDLFVDSLTRRRLKAFPKQSVVLAGAETDGPLVWNRVVAANPETEPIVRSIMDAAEHWEKDPQKRIDFFSTLLGHENKEVRSLAHLEVGRAPYGVIRTLGEAIPRHELRAFLANIRYLEWHALYILLLAQSHDERDHAYIEDSLRGAAQFGTSNRLAAWVTAWIELEEEQGLEFVRKHYLENPNRKPEELEAVIQALSVHGTNGHTQLREQIVAAYQNCLTVHPAMTPNIVPDAIAWKRTEFTNEIESYLDNNPGAFCVQVSDALPCSCPDDNN